MKHLSITVKYALFAGLATGINIAVQRGVGRIVQGPLSLYFLILSGTTAGLIVKYLLDKRFIFHYQPPSRSDEAIKVLLYLMMSAFATAVFWAVELSFDALFDFTAARYLGAAVGLTLGYSLKYELDKRFVFTQPAGDEATAEGVSHAGPSLISAYQNDD
jgi:drug/metabolite transporter (DMT)-like permease